MLQFANPSALLLVLILPLIVAVGYGWGVRRGRIPTLSLVLRLTAVAALALALAQPLLARGTGAATTVFVVDQSLSVAANGENAAAGWLQDALSGASATDRAAVIVFGASPSVAAVAGPARAAAVALEQGEALPEAERNFTAIAPALALARALPLGGGRRVVLVSDGAENIGSAMDQAAQAAGDTPIDVLPAPGVVESDLRIIDAHAPAAIWAGAAVPVTANVFSPAPGPGEVQLFADGALVATEQTTFTAGPSSHAFQALDLPPGRHELEVRVRGEPALDRVAGNNAAPLAVLVRDQPELLLIAPEGADAGVLAGALTRGGAKVTTTVPAEMPVRLSDLGAYDGFVLDNAPAADFTPDQLDGLRTATRSLGRGTIVVGGTASYGPGGYAGSDLETMLPVTVKVTDGRQRPRVSMLLIIDKSGSMSFDPGASSGKITLAKDAVRGAIEALADGDEIGVMAFSDRQEWVVPLTTLDGEATRLDIEQLVAGIDADGGTEILPALSAGLDVIRNAESDVRHIVLVTDGKSKSGSPELYEKFLAEARADRTTVSTIAIGRDADTELLQSIATSGGGRSHLALQASDVPRFTLQEARSAGSQSIVRGEFPPIQSAPSPILEGFAPEELPTLDGYDFTAAKPGAQTVLMSDRGDPVLASWQYGLGRVVAWTADDGSDLAANWARWPRGDEFWGAMTRWALPDPENQPVQTTIARDGQDMVLTVSAGGEDMTADLGDLRARVLAGDEVVLTERALTRTGPGIYQLRLQSPPAGVYWLELNGSASSPTGGGTHGFVVPPSPELQPAPGGELLLRDIAARTGGRVLSLDDPAAAFAATGAPTTAVRAYEPVWPYPLALALLALILDIAARAGVFRLPARWFARSSPG